MAALPELRRGRIVWANVADRRGVKKRRPVIVLTATERITSDSPFRAMAITSTFPDPAPTDHVEIPWHPRGTSATRLRRRSAAVLHWLLELHPDDVLEYHGDVPAKLMIQILDRLRDLAQDVNGT